MFWYVPHALIEQANGNFYYSKYMIVILGFTLKDLTRNTCDWFRIQDHTFNPYFDFDLIKYYVIFVIVINAKINLI